MVARPQSSNKQVITVKGSNRLFINDFRENEGILSCILLCLLGEFKGNSWDSQDQASLLTMRILSDNPVSS